MQTKTEGKSVKVRSRYGSGMEKMVYVVDSGGPTIQVDGETMTLDQYHARYEPVLKIAPKPLVKFGEVALNGETAGQVIRKRPTATGERKKHEKPKRTSKKIRAERQR